MAYCVEESRAKKSEDEILGDLWIGLEIERPKEKHPDRPCKQLK